jgi:hypothetical protein
MQEGNIDIPEIKLDGEPMAEKRRFKLLKVKFSFKEKKKVGMILAAVLVIIVILGIAIGIPGMAIYTKAKILNADYRQIKDAVSKQDINLVKTSVDKFKVDLGSFQSSYNLLTWTKFVPVLGNYWRDGDSAIRGGQYSLDAADIAIQTATPYADIIGFAGKGQKAKNGEENANDRITFIASSIKDVIPKVDEISTKAKLAKEKFDQIDPNRYPVSFSGKPVRSEIKKLLDLIDEGTNLVTDSKPLLEATPYLMGIDSPRTYLVLFQNDKELRPTGGFITGYSVMTVDKGKASSVTSNDIYNLDKAYTPTIKAPDPIVKYIKGPYVISTGLRLRDMNFNPDFKNSMSTFVKEAQKAGIPKIDGVIAVDTQVLVNVLSVIGNVGVPGYGNFNTTISPECNCPEVIHELESFADVEGSIVWDQNDPTKIIFAPANYNNRKAIVGPLMNSVLKNAMGQPKEKLSALFQAAWDSLTQKHVLFYMLDNKAQAGVESFDIAGRVQDTPKDSDYLLINDANLGGRKSNLYVTSEVDQKVDIAGDGSVTKTVTLTYKNSQGYDGWLNSVLPSWLRIYVPKGSILISLEGLTDKQNAYDELGKTVFAGSYSLRPLGVSTITVKYKLPFKVKSEYDLFAQKQPGVNSIMYSVKVGRQSQSAVLKMDQEFKFKL